MKPKKPSIDDIGRTYALGLEQKAIDAGVPMQHVCVQAGIHQDVFQKWKRGASSPTVRSMHRMHEALDKLIADKAAGKTHRVKTVLEEE